jgi:hypothetical protein
MGRASGTLQQCHPADTPDGSRPHRTARDTPDGLRHTGRLAPCRYLRAASRGTERMGASPPVSWRNRSPSPDGSCTHRTACALTGRLAPCRLAESGGTIGKILEMENNITTYNLCCMNMLPHGVLFRGGVEERIRTKLLKDGHIDTVIGLPPNLFYSTSSEHLTKSQHSKAHSPWATLTGCKQTRKTIHPKRQNPQRPPLST